MFSKVIRFGMPAVLLAASAIATPISQAAPANLFASVVQNIAQTQMDGPEPDRQPFKVLFRQRRQKSISG